MKKQSPPIEYPDSQAPEIPFAPSCPTCGQAWKGLAIRVCRKCGRTIGPRDKWHMRPFGPGLVALEHVNCHAAARADQA